MAKTIEGDDGKPLASGGAAINTPLTVWTSVRDNSLATPDAYAEEGNPAFISEFGTAASEGLAELGNMFKGGGGATAKLKEAMNFISNVSSSLGGSGSISSKLQSLATQAPNTLASLGISTNNEIIRNISNASNLVVKVNDAYEKIRNTDFTNVSNLAILAKDLTGLDFLSLSNQLTQVEYVSGLVKQMMDANIPNSFGILKNTIKDNKYKHIAVRDTYPAAIRNQDLRSIQSMVDTVGDRQFRSITGQSNLSGNFTNVISKDWDKNKERLDKNNISKYNEIKDTLKKVNGDKYLYINRKDNLTINIKDYLYSSDRFKELVNKGAITSNKIKISEDSSVNNEILDAIAGNSNTKIDDEKFLTAMNLGTYLTPRESIKKHFPRVYIEPNLVYLK